MDFTVKYGGRGLRFQVLVERLLPDVDMSTTCEALRRAVAGPKLNASLSSAAVVDWDDVREIVEEDAEGAPWKPTKTDGWTGIVFEIISNTDEEPRPIVERIKELMTRSAPHTLVAGYSVEPEDIRNLMRLMARAATKDAVKNARKNR